MESGPRPILNPEQKYCADCASLILRRAEICPACGCRQSAPPSLVYQQPLEPQIPSIRSQTDVFQAARQYIPESLKSQPATSPDAGKMAMLFVGNFFWSGLGNLLVEDKRGWAIGFANWIVFAISIYTAFLPSLLFYGFACYLGYQFLNEEAKPDTHFKPTSTLGLSLPPSVPDSQKHSSDPEKPA